MEHPKTNPVVIRLILSKATRCAAPRHMAPHGATFSKTPAQNEANCEMALTSGPAPRG
jgi:hypothetical protein